MNSSHSGVPTLAELVPSKIKLACDWPSCRIDFDSLAIAFSIIREV